MGAPHYSSLLARMNEYPPDAQAGRDLYFLGRSQATVMNPVANIGAGYLDRAHLLPPSSSRTGYGSQLSGGIADRVRYMGIGKRGAAGEILYGNDGNPLLQT